MRIINADELLDIIDRNENFTDIQKIDLIACVNACCPVYDADGIIKKLEKLRIDDVDASNEFEVGTKYGVSSTVESAIEIVK